MNCKDILKMIAKDGWVLKSIEGSHRHFVHPTKSGKVTVPGHDKKDLPPKTVNSILKQAGLK